MKSNWRQHLRLSMKILYEVDIILHFSPQIESWTCTVPGFEVQHLYGSCITAIYVRKSSAIDEYVETQVVDFPRHFRIPTFLMWYLLSSTYHHVVVLDWVGVT